MTRPTPEQIAAARDVLMPAPLSGPSELNEDGIEALHVLLAATEPQEQTPDPRPDDIAELARLTAIELRRRGIIADDESGAVVVMRFVDHKKRFGMFSPTRRAAHSMFSPDFDNLGPIGCADVLQAEEARRAREWAGDK